MILGLYAAANGMMAVEDRQAVIANNIANATTTGFKRQLAVQKGYYQAFFGEARSTMRLDLEIAPGGGLKTIETFSDFGNGIVRFTGNPLDVALIGPGFIRVETPDGVQFTRSGRLSVSVTGELVTAHGYNVLDTEDLPIDVSGGLVDIDSLGIVTVNDELRGQISIVEFEDPHALGRTGYTLYRASQAVMDAAIPAESTTVAVASLEGSNVQLPAEMANMMMALRAYAANQRVISAIDETLSRLINQVG
ncbi:MAG: flagellar hook-basal body protein, partial [Candidatus Hydrogenedentes bacterium]|nr:flagellar hook-basal body protein [Candidatus Hydrogenedentota bacterium]